jgi:competence protein CoiA
MAFSSLAGSDRVRVDITKLNNPRQELPGAPYICAMCEGEMFPKIGSVIAPHFAHKHKCTSTIGHHPESPEHESGKTKIAQYLRNRYAKTGEVVDIEVILPLANRRADIMVTGSNGQWRTAHEVQLSPITPAELEERTTDYAKEGVEIVWWLGGKANTDENRNWCLLYSGTCGIIEFSTETNNFKI